MDRAETKSGHLHQPTSPRLRWLKMAQDARQTKDPQELITSLKASGPVGLRYSSSLTKEQSIVSHLHYESVIASD